MVWWGQLAIRPLWAQELSFEHLLEIARTQRDRQLRSFLPNMSLGSAFLSLLCLPNRTTCHLAYLYSFRSDKGLAALDRNTADGTRACKSIHCRIYTRS